MKKTTEIELKFAVEKPALLEEFLEGLEQIGEKRVADEYFDTSEGKFFKKAVFIRIRNKKQLDFKYNFEDFENLHEECEEHSFEIPLKKISLPALSRLCRILDLKPPENPSWDSLKRVNRLKVFVKINRQRKIYEDRDFKYAHDKVKKLGDFLEAEKMINGKKSLATVKEKMRKRLAGLGLKPVNVGYVELYLRKHDFNLYRQGRYILSEDKK